MKKIVTLVLIFTFLLTLVSCKETNFNESNTSNDTQSIDVSNESDLSEETQIVKIPIETSGDTSILPYHIGDYLFSNTGAKTEDFVVYDGIAEESLITDEHIGCKIHCLAYHGYTDFRIYNLGSEEDRKKFCERYWLSNTLINGKTPVCEGYNQIQMIWDLGITPKQIEKEVGSYEELANELRELDVFSEKEISRYKTFYIGPESKMTDEDLDLIQMAWKNPFCVYTHKCFYTIDWLNEHSAEDYFEHKLPIDQLEDIYAQKDNGALFVEFLGERINKYKKMLSDKKSDSSKDNDVEVIVHDIYEKIKIFKDITELKLKYKEIEPVDEHYGIVIDERFKSIEDIRTFIFSLFTSDTAKEYIDNIFTENVAPGIYTPPLYTEKNGNLHMLKTQAHGCEFLGFWDYEKVTFELKDDASIYVIVPVYTVSSDNNFTQKFYFNIIKSENNWLIDSFGILE